MKNVDVLVLGGGAAGIVAAMTAKQNYPDREVLVIRREERVLVPCGIPYIFGTLGSVEKDLIPDGMLEKAGVELLIGDVTDVNLQKKIATTSEGEEVRFDKLILATGSVPVKPPIEGLDKDGVFYIKKDAQYLRNLFERVKESERIIIVGGGFIGVELADEIRKLGKEVIVVEMRDHILQASFDDEFCVLAEEELRRQGVELYTGRVVKKVLGEDRVKGVLLSGDVKLTADLVIVSAGMKPNTKLAEQMGLRVSRYGIEVDEYMRTSHPDVFAVGDCAEKRDFFTRKPKPVMLASVATAEARIAGANLYRIKAFRQFRGTLGIFATKIGKLSLGAAGLIERTAKKEGFEYVVGRSKVPNRHPPSLPETGEIFTKLIFTKQGGFFLGGQVAGGNEVGVLINLIGMAIESGYTASQYLSLQIGTHPLLTPAPTTPATLKAAEDALRKIYP